MKQTLERRARKTENLSLAISDQDYPNLCCDFPGLGEDMGSNWVKEAPKKSEGQQQLWIPHFSLVALKIGATGKTRKVLSPLKHNKTKGYSAVMICSIAKMVLNIFRAHSLFNIM